MAPTTAVAKKGDESKFEVDPDQALKASKALLAHIQKSAKEAAASAAKKNILDLADNDDEAAPSLAETPIWMTITTKRHIHDTKKLQPGKIILPHPLHTSSGSGSDPSEATLCLIVPDPQRYYKNLVASADFPAALRQRITRVVDIKHLTAKFRQYEAQRKLFAEHDIFLADERIINRLPKALGNTFYKSTAKRPIPVVFGKRKPHADAADAKKKNPLAPARRRQKTGDPAEDAHCRPAAEVAAEIEKAIGAALVHLSPSTNTAVKVGFASMDPNALSENIVKASHDMATKFVPKKKNGIKSIFIKGPRSVALPIWQDDELWLDAETDVIAAGSDLAKAIEAKKEQANVGKKRKAAADDDEEPSAKKAKNDSLPEADDENLNKQISQRKSKLRSAKAKAKSALEE